ncbi:hypothetical protein [Legionella saoudiensis]|uniref:hypothetical protein n=1 Tax=Legionella saoudiensis TaxID=1750561 RepID=UPI00072FF1C9|nr:hypothetical protein [Legionella saoudiensis]
MALGPSIEYVKMTHATNLADREYDRKFKMFFTGLIFAIISFTGSHPITTHSSCLKMIEIVALSFLLLSGLLLLGKLSLTQVNPSLSYKDLPCKLKLVYFIFESKYSLLVIIYMWNDFIVN